MKLRYEKDIDQLFVSFKQGVRTLGKRTKFEDITLFVDKDTRKETVAIEIDGLAENIENLTDLYNFSTKELLAISLYLFRTKKGLKQEDMATMLHSSLANYKKIEKAEISTNIDIFDHLEKNGISHFNKKDVFFGSAS